MQHWTRPMKYLLAIILSIMLVPVESKSASSQKKAAIPANQSSWQGSAITGEVDEEEDIVFLPKKKSKSVNHAQKKANQDSVSGEKSKFHQTKIPQKKNKPIIHDKEKLLQVFHRAGEFHNEWFHLEPENIKTSLEKLRKFCRLACTAKQCRDEEIANHCHLICPNTTTRACPDPLHKEQDHLEIDESALTDFNHDGPSFLPKTLKDMDRDLMEEEEE